MQILYSYDSGNLLKQKFEAIGIKYSGNVSELKDIVIKKIIQEAKSDFLKEITSKYSLTDFFDFDKNSEIIQIYKKYFNIPEEYFSEYFFRSFSDPSHVAENYILENKEKLFEKYPAFYEDTFSEKDFDKLKLSYLYDSLLNCQDLKKSFSVLDLSFLYTDYFKGRYSRLKYKSNAKVRKLLSLHKYFGILDTFDKIDVLTQEKYRFEAIIAKVESESRPYYRIPYDNVIKTIDKLLEDLNKNL